MDANPCGSRAFRLGRADRSRPEHARVRRIALVVAVVGALAGASSAPAGGIADEPCPNARGEHTNTCPPGTVGMPYAVRFVESDGSGCGPGRQTFHLDSGLLPPGLTLEQDGTLTGTAMQAGSFQFYVEMREPQDDPSNCAGKRTQKQFTLKIRGQPWISSSPATPLGSEVGIPFRMTLRARGGSGIFSWELVAGKLPVGVRLRDDGSIVGTPRTAGTYSFVARARDTESRSLRWPVTLAVAPRLRIRAQRLARRETRSFLQRQPDRRRRRRSEGVEAQARPPPSRYPPGAGAGPLERYTQPGWHAPRRSRSQRRTQRQVHQHSRHRDHSSAPKSIRINTSSERTLAPVILEPEEEPTSAPGATAARDGRRRSRARAGALI